MYPPLNAAAHQWCPECFSEHDFALEQVCAGLGSLHPDCGSADFCQQRDGVLALQAARIRARGAAWFDDGLGHALCMFALKVTPE